MSNVNFVSSVSGLVVGIAYVDTSTSMSNQGSEMIGVYIGRSQGEVEALIVKHANEKRRSSWMKSSAYKDFEDWRRAYHWVIWLKAESSS